MNPKEYYVYILRCHDSSYYSGITSDIEQRIAEHKSGKDPKAYTYKRRPVELVYLTSFQDVHEAIAWEKTIKGWSRKKKEALIAGEFEKLPELSRRRTPFAKKT